MARVKRDPRLNAQFRFAIGTGPCTYRAKLHTDACPLFFSGSCIQGASRLPHTLLALLHVICAYIEHRRYHDVLQQRNGGRCLPIRPRWVQRPEFARLGILVSFSASTSHAYLTAITYGSYQVGFLQFSLDLMPDQTPDQ